MSDQATTAPAASLMPRLKVLDGWRAVSILCVLAAHMLPLRLGVIRLNETAGLIGMSLFFTLSGFLITSTLVHNPSVSEFLIRRAFRLLPAIAAVLAFAVAVGLLPLGSLPEYAAFLMNYQHEAIVPHMSHFWSLCVEVHFYLAIALLVCLTRRRALWVLALAAVAVTATRVAQGVHYSIATHLRVDEILAGCVLALMFQGNSRSPSHRMLQRLNQPLLILLLLGASHAAGGPLNYFRPYFAAAIVGATLLQPASLMSRALTLRPLGYIATISYAAYLWHPLTMAGWLGSGDLLVKYAKRPICFILTLAAAHGSTFYLELPMIALGKRIIRARRQRGADTPTAAASPVAPT